MSAPIVVFAVGNPSRGDDALGPWLAARLAEWQVAHPGQVEVVEDFQLQIEHALDLVGRQLAVFIDADLAAPPPFAWRTAQPGAVHAGVSTHALAPAQVLAVYAQTEGVPPPSFILGVRGEAFDLGAGLSDAAQRHASAAWDFLQARLATADPGAWQSSIRQS